MNNKILINVDIPELDSEYDVFIPVNELVWKVNKLVLKSISDLSGVPLNTNDKYVFINKITNKVYNNNEIIIDTEIRNGTELILLKI